MWLRTRRTTRSAVARGKRSRARRSPASRRPERLMADEPAVRERRRLADVVEEGRDPDHAGDRPARRRRSGRCDPRGPRRAPCSGGCHAGRRARARSSASRPVASSGRSPTRRQRCGEEPVELGGDPLAGEVLDELGPAAHRVEGRRLDRELQGRGEPGRPDHPQGILAEPRVRVADRPEDAQGEVGPTVVRIHEPGRIAGSSAPGHRVDGQVAPSQVLVDRVAELDPVRSPEVGVVVVASEGRDLERLAPVADRRPSRTGSRRPRRGRPRRSAPGGRRWPCPSRTGPGRGGGRGASRRPRSRHDRPPGAPRGDPGPRPGTTRPRASRRSAAGPGTGSRATPRCARPRDRA